MPPVALGVFSFALVSTADLALRLGVALESGILAPELGVAPAFTAVAPMSGFVALGFVALGVTLGVAFCVALGPGFKKGLVLVSVFALGAAPALALCGGFASIRGEAFVFTLGEALPLEDALVLGFWSACGASRDERAELMPE